MLTKIYLIQAHQYPRQLLRLIKKLLSDNVFFFIHIDLKSRLQDFNSIIDFDNVFFIEKRVDCIWGDFSQVQATLNMIEEVFKRNFPKDSRITLLSGQDYPIKSLKSINDFLENNKEVSFINIETIAQSGLHHLKNLKSYKINHSSSKNDYTMVSFYHYKSTLKNVFRRKLEVKYLKLLFIDKKIPFNITPFRGSQWWSFPLSTLVEIVGFYKSNECVLFEFYSSTFCADECFFQMILMHLNKNDSRYDISSSLTYDNWVRENCELPVTFSAGDFDELMQQPNSKLFARKFNSMIDESILDQLDKI